jgi:hypothetical protein
VVGNPPFIGTKRMKHALGDGYVEALRKTWPEVPESADFVMYWWHHAAELVRAGELRRFGLITTNSLRQAFNRRVLEVHLSDSKRPLSVVFAIPDHPWVDSAEGAAVRVAMTVAQKGRASGQLLLIEAERSGDEDAADLELSIRSGFVNPDLTVGANTTLASPLLANSGIAGMGVALHGSGFTLEPDIALRIRAHGSDVVKGYVGGRDLVRVTRERYLIDFFGMSQDEALRANPAAFQHVIDYVKPERDHNNRAALKRLWWRFGWERPVLRYALRNLSRYIGTPETARHRIFQFIDGSMLADHKVVCIADARGETLGILSARVHTTWAHAAGGRLGAGNDPVYNKTRCFDPFPFPASNEPQVKRIRALAEDLDAHRKHQQTANPKLTLTGMYNVLEKLKSGEPLTAKEREVHEQGLVSILKQLHDELDLAVLDAYGWGNLAPLMEIVNGNAQPATAGVADREEARRALDQALLERLVALNAERAAEERRGLVRWLRPDFQQPEGAPAAAQDEIDLGEAAAAVATITRRPWPKTLTEQVKAVAETLAAIPEPVTEAELAARFTARGPWRRRLANILEMLVTLGQARQEGSHYRAVGDAR